MRMNVYKQINTQFIRYILVGIATALVDYLAFTTIFLLSGNYLVAENLKLPFMLGFNYIAHRLFTFNSSRKIRTESAKYVLVNILIFIVSNLSLVVLVNVLVNVQIAKLAQLIVMPTFTYLLLNRFVYINTKTV